MISALHTLAAVKIHPDGLSSTVLGGITQQMVRAGSDVRQNPTSGSIYSTHQATYAVEPTAEFTTVNPATALAVCGMSGLAIASTTNPGLVFYGNKKVKGGGRATSTNHLSYTLRNGILIPVSLSCGHREDLSLSLRAMATYDGTNNPLIPASGVALPAGGIDLQRFSLGKILLGTESGDQIELSAKTRVEITFDLQAEAKSADGDLYPTYATINDMPRPMLSITVLDVSLLGSITLAGKLLDASHSVIYFRKHRPVRRAATSTMRRSSTFR